MHMSSFSIAQVLREKALNFPGKDGNHWNNSNSRSQLFICYSYSCCKVKRRFYCRICLHVSLPVWKKKRPSRQKNSWLRWESNPGHHEVAVYMNRLLAVLWQCPWPSHTAAPEENSRVGCLLGLLKAQVEGVVHACGSYVPCAGPLELAGHPWHGQGCKASTHQ